MIALLDVLLVLSKKFGKQFASPSVQEFLATQYPEASRLFTLLARAPLSYKTLYQLRHTLYLGLGTHHISVQMSHLVPLTALDTDDLSVGSGGGNPSLVVRSGDKIYRRSFYDDLTKIFG